MKKNKKEFSKKLCIIAILIFIITVITALVFSALSLDTESFTLIVPSAGTVCSVCLGFYYNKAKMENLSKQRIRTELIRLTLAGKLDEDVYEELCDELDHIDGTVEAKMASMYEEVVDEEIETNLG